MTTEKQLEANRQNAKLGGVKTEEGKAISKYNALKHGLLSKEVLLKREDEKSLTELGQKLRNEIKPQTEIEVILVDRIIANVWRLRRLLEVEKNTMEWQKQYGVEESIFGDISKEEKRLKGMRGMIANDDMEKLIRYETTIERSIYKTLHELQRIQSARAGEKTPAPIAIDVDVSKE